jgi:hypothetical protein
MGSTKLIRGLARDSRLRFEVMIVRRELRVMPAPKSLQFVNGRGTGAAAGEADCADRKAPAHQRPTMGLVRGTGDKKSRRIGHVWQQGAGVAFDGTRVNGS